MYDNTLSDAYYEAFFGWIIVIFFIIIPAIIGIVVAVHLNRLTKIAVHCTKEVEKGKWNIKWGFKHGKPYIKDQGWGPNYDKRSEVDYFSSLYDESKKENDKLRGYPLQ